MKVFKKLILFILITSFVLNFSILYRSESLINTKNVDFLENYKISSSSGWNLWEYNSGSSVNSVAISGDGGFIVAGNDAYKVILFNKNSRTPNWEYTSTDKINSVAISEDGLYLVAGDADNNVLLFTKNNPTPLKIFNTNNAINFVAISADGEYLGGAIAPGIGIAADALFQRTAKLPRVELIRPPSVIGSNTARAIQSGLIFGYVGLVEGVVARFRDELGSDMIVIGTGGLAELIASETDVIEIVAPWLTLEGLRLIWEMNQEG